MRSDTCVYQGAKKHRKNYKEVPVGEEYLGSATNFQISVLIGGRKND